MLDISKIIKILSNERPIFMSEKDFQFALAWVINEQYSNCEIKLERYTVLNSGRNSYIDIVIEFNNRKENYAIELKYLTKKFKTIINGEEYNLKNQGAQDLVRYDFNKDIMRLEKLKKIEPNVKKGYAIILSNDSNIWIDSRRPCGYADFKIHDKDLHTGILCWNTNFVGPGTMKGREQDIILTGKYSLEWKDYSNFNEKNGLFRYLVVEI